MDRSSNGELDDELSAVVNDLFSDYERYGYDFLHDLVLAIAAMPEDVPKSELIIQKFSDQLARTSNGAFVPSIYLGGSYSYDISQSLDKLVESGVLEQKSGEDSGIGAPVYELSEEFDIEPPSAWTRQFELFRTKVGFRKESVLRESRQELFNWLSDQESYVGVDERLLEFLTRFDSDDKTMDMDGSMEPSFTNSLDPKYHDVASIAFNLIDEYKYIPPRREKHTDRADLARRTFSVHHLLTQYEDNREGVIDDFVFFIGYFEPQDSQPPIFSFKENPGSNESIKVRFQGELETDFEEIFRHSIGVVGIVSEREEKPIIEAIGLLKSYELPQSLIEHLDIDLTKFRAEIMKQSELIEKLEDNPTELLQRLVDEHIENATLNIKGGKTAMGLTPGALNDLSARKSNKIILFIASTVSIILATITITRYFFPNVIEGLLYNAIVLFPLVSLLLLVIYYDFIQSPRRK